ncbi:MAG TPA: hypothetical protein PLL20_18645 [Phycisphaerae bacterium]|nr:hypothetical protein [Phycisphaerae bacterium]HRR84652.1 hypothetical protein [Phycisphaerae bacterium]
MKRMTVVVAVLMMAGIGYGATFSVTSGGSPVKIVAPGEEFMVQINLDPQGMELVSWGVVIEAPDGYKIPGAPGVAAYAPGVAQGWSATDGNTAWQGSNWPRSFPAGPIFNVFGDVFGITAAGPVFEMKVRAPMDPAALMGEITVTGAYVGDTDFVEHSDVNVVGLRVVPEPVSALLLLAGVPMLRRRR